MKFWIKRFFSPLKPPRTPKFTKLDTNDLDTNEGYKKFALEAVKTVKNRRLRYVNIQK